jgi:hypothetical protein
MKKGRITFENAGPPAGRFRTGVSLHSHTLHSHENLSFIDRLGRTIKPIRILLERLYGRYQRTHGHALDLDRAYWTPPLAPGEAHQLEHDHVARFEMNPLVSLTDHDSIDAALTLRVLDSFRDVPISVEWTVPFNETFFHLGVHNLPPETAAETMRELAAFTASPGTAQLPSLLEAIAANPASLIVFNHPCWDENVIGEERYQSYVADFCRLYHPWLHAVEFNGLRPWKGNADAIALAARTRKPVISGGDRHGLEPNTVLNLTNASTFGEFVEEVRSGMSNVLITNQYFEPFVSRVFRSTMDMLANYEGHCQNWVRWSDRVFYRCDDGDIRQLSAVWPRAAFGLWGGVQPSRTLSPAPPTP